MSKKQNSVSLSTAEAEYIAAGSCCSQLLWMKNFFMIMGSLKTPCASSVTTLVPLIYPRTLFNTQSQNILKFNIISFETWWRRKLYSWNLSALTIKRLIFALNPLMVHGLNHFVRPLMSVSSLDSYLLCDLLLFIGSSLLKRSHMLSCFFFKPLFVFLVFVDLTLFFLFFSVLKNSKTHKK